jgi:hypothetical protein
MIYEEQFFLGRSKKTGQFVSLKKKQLTPSGFKLVSVIVKPSSSNGNLF